MSMFWIYRSFAYYTITERLPIIVTKIVDQTTRDKDVIAELFNGEVHLKLLNYNKLIFILPIKQKIQ